MSVEEFNEFNVPITLRITPCKSAMLVASLYEEDFSF